MPAQLPPLPGPLAAAGVTRRESEVLQLVGQRLRNREIAERLFLSDRAVESHISSLLAKLNAPDRQALVDLAARLHRPVEGRSLPEPLSSFIGRGRELEELLD